MSVMKYSPMVFMFFSKTAKNLIYNIHKCTLPVSHQVDDAGLEDLLQKDNSATIHQEKNPELNHGSI